MAHTEHSAEDSIIVKTIASDQRTSLFPRLFAIERLWITILPTIKPVKRTFIAAVQAKKTVLTGIGVIKFQTDGDIVKGPIMPKREKTKCINESI